MSEPISATAEARKCVCDLPWYQDEDGNATAQNVCARFEADASSLFCKLCEHAELCHAASKGAQERKPICVCELDPAEGAVCDSPEYEFDHFNGRVCINCDHDAACHTPLISQ